MFDFIKKGTKSEEQPKDAEKEAVKPKKGISLGPLFKRGPKAAKLPKDKKAKSSQKGFSSLKLSGKKAVWGIEIGDKDLRAAMVRFSDGKMLIEKAERIEYTVSDQNATPKKTEQIEEAINTFINRNPIEKTDKIIFSLSGKMVLSRFVSLPPMKKGKIADAIKFELRKQIPFEPSEIVWDSHRFEAGTTSSKRTEVGIFATKKENIHSLLPCLASVKMNIEAIQTIPVAIYNLIRMGFTANGDVVVVNVEKENTDFVVVGETTFWNRSISISEVNLDLVREVQRSMGYYVSLTKGATPKNILLMGEIFDDDEKVKFVKENIEGSVSLVNLLDRVVISKDVDSSVLSKETINGFGTVLGLALQGLGLGRININFLPFEYIKERLVPKRKALVKAITALVFLCFLVQGIKNYVTWKAHSEYVGIAASMSDKVGRLERNYKKVAKQIKEEEKRLQTLSIGTRGDHLIEVIRSVIDIMPEDVYLLSLKSSWDPPYTVDKEEKKKKKKKRSSKKGDEKVLIMNISGESYNSRITYIEDNVRNSLEKLKLANQETPALRNVEIIQGSVHHQDLDIKQGKQSIAFQIRWIVNATD